MAIKKFGIEKHQNDPDKLDVDDVDDGLGELPPYNFIRKYLRNLLLVSY